MADSSSGTDEVAPYKAGKNTRCMERLAYRGGKHQMYGKTDIKWGQSQDYGKINTKMGQRPEFPKDLHTVGTNTRCTERLT